MRVPFDKCAYAHYTDYRAYAHYKISKLHKQEAIHYNPQQYLSARLYVARK